jgi:putative transposase
LEERSLLPRFDRCGAKGKPKRCDPPKLDENRRVVPARRKAGRKTTGERITAIYNKPPPPTQPGMSTEWAAKIMAADAQIPSPKPKWGVWETRILNSAFVGKAKEADGKIEFVRPDALTYPNSDQIRRVLATGRTRLEQAMSRTTTRHFLRSMRGLVARNWKDVPGPGYAWAIDSTVGDVYLRSSINRAWIVGRPIVYVIVDIWSTAVVGFYVCLTGPSWSTAAISIFNSTCSPALLGELWDFKHQMALYPLPGMCQTLLCDRGEYVAIAHRNLAVKTKHHTQITPPYAGDLKGLVEVLHRIAKDAQFLFVPGAMDYRREELELRRIDPASCTMTVKEYAAWLQLVFAEYNFTADRSHRLDAHMLAAGVEPTPAGLWTFGHSMGIGWGRHLTESELVTNLLPTDTCRVGRSSVRFRKCDYMSKDVEIAQWTTLARNFGGSEFQAHYYPASMSRIWTPNTAGEGLLSLRISDQSRASPELTHDEFDDAIAFGLTGGSKLAHDRSMQKVYFYRQRMNIVKDSILQTQEAVAKASGIQPTQTEARVMEVAKSRPHQSEAKTREEQKEELQERAMSEFEQMMKNLRGGNVDSEDSDA